MEDISVQQVPVAPSQAADPDVPPSPLMPPPSPGPGHEHNHRRYLLLLTLGALGVVYGDIGTSPLYAFRECFHSNHGIPHSVANIYGVLSMIIWTLVIVVSLKYLCFVLRADNKGEGGVLALMALLLPFQRGPYAGRKLPVIFLGMFGAALLYGDGIITPAISVLSAVEGLEIATPVFSPFVVPLTLIILISLFLIQSRGTARIGIYFGPIILIWFIALTILGIRGIMMHPQILYAFSPHFALAFLFEHGPEAYLALGAVFLAATGAEALYADMGHFGRKPIRLGWFLVALPALLINYLGQGALLAVNPEAVANPFFMLAPSWMVIPLVILATMATVIASQALISGAFSLTSQAVQLGYLPRLEILHTSSREIGQIFIPFMNTVLLIFTLLLVVTFRSSSNLASAYGFSVSCTMVITTCLLYFLVRQVWKWSLPAASIVIAFFGIIDLLYFGANVLKLFDGGWVPLLIGVVIFTIMTTWYRGREILAERLREFAVPLLEFIGSIQVDSSIRVPGAAVFMSRDIDRVPTALLHNVKHNKVVHKTVILLRVLTEDEPHVPDERRIEVIPLKDGFFKITLRYGFMETPDVPQTLKRCLNFGPEFDPTEVTYFLGRETVLPSERPGMELWREKLFAFMTKLASRANTFYHVPSSQVIEIGSQIEI